MSAVPSSKSGTASLVHQYDYDTHLTSWIHLQSNFRKRRGWRGGVWGGGEGWDCGRRDYVLLCREPRAIKGSFCVKPEIDQNIALHAPPCAKKKKEKNLAHALGVFLFLSLRFFFFLFCFFNPYAHLSD